MSVDVYADNTVTTRMPPQLIRGNIAGEGADNIRWGSGGDWDRCRRFLRRKGVPEPMLEGACANLHKLATGEWPGRNAHKGAHDLILDYIIAAGAPDASSLIRWEGPLALVGEATGDRRRFPNDTLKYQSFPQPFRFQRQGLQGHQGAVTVGVIEDAREQMYAGKQKELQGKRVVWGRGYFLDPKIIPEVNEAIHLAEHGVSGPSVDLDSYTAVLRKNAMSGETTADMVRGRQRAATLVSVPAFADLRITILRPDTAIVAADTANLASDATFAVNPGGWRGAPIAPREALFDADDAAKRIEAWANGDPDKMAKMFLWIADSANAPLIGRKGYRLPWGDIIDDKPMLIFHAVYAAAALLEGAHGGLPAIPEEQKGQLRTVISQIYEQLAREFDDGSIVAPWDRQVQQASAPPEEGGDNSDDYAAYLAAFDAALEEFRGRYTESKHPRDKRKNDHAGEWVDVPKHDAHGRIKVGSKWVYPPKKGEKGWRNPEAAVRAKAKRGAGSPAGKKATETRVVKKAQKPSPDKGSERKQPSHPAPAKRAPKREPEKTSSQERKEEVDRMVRLLGEHDKASRAQQHINALKEKNRQEQKKYLGKLSDEDIDGLMRKTQGQRLDDDTRDDLETEIIRRVNKTDDEKSQEQKSKERRERETQERMREIDHGGGKKTVVAKKKPPEKKESEEKAPSLTERMTMRIVRDEGDGGITKSNRKLPSGAKDQLDDLVERGLLEKRGRGRYHLTDKGRNSLKGHESEEPETKGPEVKVPEKKTTVARKKTGEAKGYTPNAAQQKALEDIRDGGKGHPGSRKVLEREGYVDSDGKLTDKGRSHLGITGTKESQSQDKRPEKKTTVVSKTGQHKLTRSQRQVLEDTRDLGTAGVRIHSATKKVLVREGFIQENGRLTNKGRRAIGMPERDSEEESAQTEKVADTDKDAGGEQTQQGQKKAAAVKKTAAERDQEKVDTALAQYSQLQDANKVDEVLRGLQRRHLEKIARAQGIDVDRSDTAATLLSYLRTHKAHMIQSEKYRQQQRERIDRVAKDKKQREADYAARVGGDRAFRPVPGRPWWEQITEDTGPEGVHAQDVELNAHATGNDSYVMKSGTLYRRGGVSYLVEDGDDMLPPSDVAAEFDEFHASLPKDLAHYQRGYVWVRSANPADKYWERHYNMPGFKSLATAGDGSVRVWDRGGFVAGPSAITDELRHEFGHTVSYGVGRKKFAGEALHDSQVWLVATRTDPARRKVRQDEVVHAEAHEGGIRSSIRFKLTPGDPDKKAFVQGVSEYGQNSASEDFAESVAMYTHVGPLGFVFRDGRRMPVYFEDLFPGRAKLLADLLPELAARYRKLIADRGPL